MADRSQTPTIKQIGLIKWFLGATWSCEWIRTPETTRVQVHSHDKITLSSFFSSHLSPCFYPLAHTQQGNSVSNNFLQIISCQYILNAGDVHSSTDRSLSHWVPCSADRSLSHTDHHDMLTDHHPTQKLLGFLRDSDLPAEHRGRLWLHPHAFIGYVTMLIPLHIHKSPHVFYKCFINVQ